MAAHVLRILCARFLNVTFALFGVLGLICLPAPTTSCNSLSALRRRCTTGCPRRMRQRAQSADPEARGEGRGWGRGRYSRLMRTVGSLFSCC